MKLMCFVFRLPSSVYRPVFRLPSAPVRSRPLPSAPVRSRPGPSSVFSRPFRLPSTQSRAP
eukprot:7242979-Prymnesium_polylepis.1